MQDLLQKMTSVQSEQEVARVLRNITQNEFFASEALRRIAERLDPPLPPGQQVQVDARKEFIANCPHELCDGEFVLDRIRTSQNNKNIVVLHRSGETLPDVLRDQARGKLLLCLGFGVPQLCHGDLPFDLLRQSPSTSCAIVPERTLMEKKHLWDMMSIVEDTRRQLDFLIGNFQLGRTVPLSISTGFIQAQAMQHTHNQIIKGIINVVLYNGNITAQAADFLENHREILKVLWMNQTRQHIPLASKPGEPSFNSQPGMWETVMNMFPEGPMQEMAREHNHELHPDSLDSILRDYLSLEFLKRHARTPNLAILGFCDKVAKNEGQQLVMDALDISDEWRISLPGGHSLMDREHSYSKAVSEM